MRRRFALRIVRSGASANRLRRSLRAKRKDRRNVSACAWGIDEEVLCSAHRPFRRIGEHASPLLEGEAQGEAERVRLRRGKPMRSRFALRIGGSFASANMLRRSLRAKRKDRRNVSACVGESR
jgi:hypothetical protein